MKVWYTVSKTEDLSALDWNRLPVSNEWKLQFTHMIRQQTEELATSTGIRRTGIWNQKEIEQEVDDDNKR